jgi:ABC-type phosphate transport system substrate-binding protein
MRFVSKIAVVAAAAATVMGVGLGPALADPPSGTLPKLTDVVGVGSDTTQLVMDAISTSYDKTHSPKLYSWDAVNPVTGGTGDNIVTKGSSGTDKKCQIARPNGSSAGIKALAATIKDGTSPCLDYARSSRGTQAGDPAGLLWVGYGKDAVSWTTPSSGTGKPATLTQAQLQAIYLCTDTKWNQVGGTSTATIVPVLPQTSSGTRAFFLKAIGVAAPGACVVNGSINIPGDPHNPVPIEENTGVSLKDSGGNYLTGNQFEFGNANVLFPYSVADWIAQTPAPAGGGHATPSSAPGVLKQPQQISGVSPVLTHSGSIDTINPSFSATFTRIVWNVMPNAGTKAAGKIPANLVPFFGPTGAVCSDKADIQSYGFELLAGTLCGNLFQTS